MSNFLDALSSAARNGVCTLLGIPQYLNDMTRRLNGGTFSPPLSEIPNFWRNALCDRPAPQPNPPPFTGGQCPCVGYRVNFTAQVNNQAPFSGQTAGLVGPILNSGIRSVAGGQEGFIRHGVCSGGQQTGTTTTVILFAGSIQSLRIDGVVRPDGQPDNCGSPEPEYEDLDPSDVTINTNISYTNALGVVVTIPIVLVYARAQIDASANITIPFTLNLSPTLGVQGTVNLDGTVNINIGTAGSSPLPKDPRKGDCGDIPLPDGEVPEDPTDSDKEPEKDRDRERVIKGVLVTVNSLAQVRATAIAQDENPDIYAPSLGFVNFLVRVGEISAGWTPDLPVKNRRCLIQCPWDDGAIEVKGTPQPGVTWTLTPVYGYAGSPVEYVQ